ncbi:uncharacterized protein LOC132951623 [Metopolophium dirhodum]|uniref:uncharacterized protein LOC132951623 n=1 Tax=Metopolophium dirhodum TaxID=44670 RepID=UPI0029903DBC|nr:uncharacterized protein LOC132951623 [Metopolophium dirhodum]
MFPSYATVPVFAFVILLNFFFLNSPIESVEIGVLYTTCQDCLAGKCHNDRNRPCMTLHDGSYLCFTCDIELGDQQYYTLDECKTGCTDPKRVCICTSMCFVCIRKLVLENGGYLEDCDLPTEQELNITCK